MALPCELKRPACGQADGKSGDYEEYVDYGAILTGEKEAEDDEDDEDFDPQARCASTLRVDTPRACCWLTCVCVQSSGVRQTTREVEQHPCALAKCFVV